MGIGVITKPATQSMKWSIGWTRPVRITAKSEAVPVISSMHWIQSLGGRHTHSSHLDEQPIRNAYL